MSEREPSEMWTKSDFSPRSSSSSSSKTGVRRLPSMPLQPSANPLRGLSSSVSRGSAPFFVGNGSSRGQNSRSAPRQHQRQEPDVYKEPNEFETDEIMQEYAPEEFAQNDATEHQLNFNQQPQFKPLHQNQQQQQVNVNNFNPVAVSALKDDRARSMFRFTHFNAMQSRSFDTAYGQDRNLVISAPTGSGKTVILELAILRLLTKQGGDRSKIIYIAPTKALCSERVQDWTSKFRVMGLSCGELTGDTEAANVRDVQQSNIIVTTPEKWDSMTRRWRDHKNLMALVHLLLIDEVHFLNEPRRGAVLEVIVSRMRTVTAEINHGGGGDGSSRGEGKTHLRIVAISATAPNVGDIAVWLKEADGRNAVTKVFGDEYRSVPLVRHVLGYESTGSAFQFENHLDYKLGDVIGRYSQGKPSMVFCGTRKSVESAAKRLVTEVENVPIGDGHPYLHGVPQQMELQDWSRRVSDRKLAEFLPHGIAIHYGTLSQQDRQIAENLFTQRKVLVICTTSTLSVGVNLPAHLVVIKGTSAYRGSVYVEYSDLDILQMMGRAGRPKFDTSGVVVIMTTNAKTEKYRNLVAGKEVIESSLHQSLIEHLNAEVVLGTIPNVELCIEWLKSTFLNVRISKNPARYKDPRDTSGKSSSLDSIMLKDLSLLAESKLIEQRDEGMTVIPTDCGRAMAKLYIRFETAKAVMEVRESPTMRVMLECLAKAEEFADVKYHADKTYLNTLNKSVKYPVSGKMTTVSDKVNVLIQCVLGSIRFTETKYAQTLNTESNLIMQHASRISRFMFEVYTLKKEFHAAEVALDLANSIHAKIWELNGYHLKQIESIGPVQAKTLFDAGIRTFSEFRARPAEQIESILNRGRLTGNKLLESANSFPQLTLSVSEFAETGPGKSNQVEFLITLGVANPNTVKVTGKRGPLYVYFLSGDVSSNLLLECRKLLLRDLINTRTLAVRVSRRAETSNIRFLLSVAEFVGLSVSQKAIVDGNPSFSKSVSGGTISAPNFPLSSTKSASILPKSSIVHDVDKDEFDLSEEDEWLSKLPDSVLDGTAIAVSSVARKSRPEAEKPVKKLDMDRTAPPSVSLWEGRVSCNHKCKNKNECEHLCCKHGIKPPKSKPKHAKISKTGQVTPTTGLKVSTATYSIFESSDEEEIPLTRPVKPKPAIAPILSATFSDDDEDDDFMPSKVLISRRAKKSGPVKSVTPVQNVHHKSDKKATSLYDNAAADETVEEFVLEDDLAPYEPMDESAVLDEWELFEIQEKRANSVVESPRLFSDSEDAMFFESGTRSQNDKKSRDSKIHTLKSIGTSSVSRANQLSDELLVHPRQLNELNRLHDKTGSYGIKPWLRPASSVPVAPVDSSSSGALKPWRNSSPSLVSGGSAKRLCPDLEALNRLHVATVSEPHKNPLEPSKASQPPDFMVNDSKGSDNRKKPKLLIAQGDSVELSVKFDDSSLRPATTSSIPPAPSLPAVNSTEDLLALINGTEVPEAATPDIRSKVKSDPTATDNAMASFAAFLPSIEMSAGAVCSDAAEDNTPWSIFNSKATENNPPV
ncbi:hypothetical protein BC830DRAFT_1233124 [Chytriomyces sp. MP71]|nr:hypothetical protein BC830DRAFT_1233124 [Chytriomyces sp. MP71]